MVLCSIENPHCRKFFEASIASWAVNLPLFTETPRRLAISYTRDSGYYQCGLRRNLFHLYGGTTGYFIFRNHLQRHWRPRCYRLDVGNDGRGRPTHNSSPRNLCSSFASRTISATEHGFDLALIDSKAWLAAFLLSYSAWIGGFSGLWR